MARGAKQTVTVKKAAARTRKQAERMARKVADRIYTSRYDEARKEWRFRQRPPGCFAPGTYGQKCIKRKGIENAVCIVYATLRPGAPKRRACR